MRLKLPRRRFTLRTLMIAVACCALAFWAAPRVWDVLRARWRTPSAFDRGAFDQEFLAWPAGDWPGELPGIDEGSCLRVRTGDAAGFVIWTDFRFSPASRGGRTSGFLTKAGHDGEKEVARWQWTADGGKRGTLSINGERYLLDDGPLLLVSTQNRAVRLKQLDNHAPDLLTTPSDRLQKRLRAIAAKDKDIGGFFTDAAGRK